MTGKILLIVAAVLVSVGITLTAGAMLLSAGKGFTLPDTGIRTNRYPVDGKVQEIDIQSIGSDVVLVLSDGESCFVECQETEEVFCTVQSENGKLTVRQEDQRKWWQGLQIGFSKMEITVYLPKGSYEALGVKSASGNIRIPEGYSFQTAELESISGDIRLASAVEQTLRVQTVSGDQYLESVQPKVLDGKSTSGECRLKNVQADSFQLESVSGDLHMESCDGAQMVLKTTSGNVKGSLCSGKDFRTHTTSGTVRLPEAAANGTCSITTVSGNIRLTLDADAG